MDALTLDVAGPDGITFTVVLDRGAMEVLIYDARHRGDSPRGSRTSDHWTADGQFVTSYLTGTLIQHGNHPLDMHGGVPDWTMPHASVALIRVWLRGVIAKGTFTMGDGTSFIGGRHVYSGPSGYRVRARSDEFYSVVSYSAAGERVAGPFAACLSESDAYALAAKLAVGR